MNSRNVAGKPPANGIFYLEQHVIIDQAHIACSDVRYTDEWVDELWIYAAGVTEGELFWARMKNDDPNLSYSLSPLCIMKVADLGNRSCFVEFKKQSGLKDWEEVREPIERIWDRLDKL